MNRKKIFSLILSMVVSALLFWLLLTRISFQDLLQTIRNISLPGLAAFVIVALVGAGLRAWRYKWLLSPQHISWRNIGLVTLIRNLFVDLLPARIGSLSYVYLLNKRLHYPFELAASTFVVAVTFDFLTLSPFLVLSLLIVGLGSTAIPAVPLLLISIFFFLALCVFLWKLPLFLKWATLFVSKILTVFRLRSKKWAANSLNKIHSTVQSLKMIQKRGIYAPIFFLSLAIRLAKYLSLYILLYALLQSHGFSFRSLSFWKTILGITGAELTGALPLKGIGGFGTWESGWALAFQLMNFESRFAILSGIGVHIITNLFEYSLGIMALTILFSSLFNGTNKKI